MRNLILALIFPLFLSAQITPEFVHLKPMFTKTVVFNYTGADQQWIVPLGVTQVFIDVAGAQGGTSSALVTGGLGGKVRAVLHVTPGETLYLMVGGQPTTSVAVYGNGGNAGINTTNTVNQSLAGGGMSAVYRTSVNITNALLVAGGGGGSGGGKNGGNAGGTVGSGTDLRGGRGGTQTAGGDAGDISDLQSVNPTAGQLGIGGVGGSTSTSTHISGGGGGGGYYGGGGGVAGGAGYGVGGGGSSWAHSSCFQISTIANFTTGNGSIVIYFN